MEYEQRLEAAAQYVLSCDTRSTDDPPLNFSEFGIIATLKPHQLEGVSWLIRRYLLGVNVILGDEMGLGKTLQAICLLSYLKVYQKSPGPFLVLCPLSVTEGWASEFANFCPNLRVLKYVGDKGVRRDLRRKIYEHVSQQSSSYDVAVSFDVLLTTYDIIMMDQDFLSQIPWCYTVIDEAQRLKNPSSVLYNVLEQHFVIPRRLLMTGTPIQNNLSELWALMHFCLPVVFGTLEQFVSTFKEVGIPLPGHDACEGKNKFKVLRYIMRAFMLRRTKSMLVESGALTLPALTEITVMAPLVSLQKKVYMSILRKELPKLLAFNPGASNHQSLQNIVVQLRKACSHPYLFNGIEPEPYVEGEHLIQASGKLIVLDQLLQKLHRAGHRVLLFAQMTHTLDILQDFLELRKYTYERLDGSIRAEERFAAIRNFSQQQGKRALASQAEQHNAFVFMISTRAGGVGLNLVAADTVIFYEQDWNPQVDKQALQRAHRIGQLNHVLSVNLVSAHTVEEVIMRRAQSKLQLSHNVIGDDTHEEGKDIKDMGAESGDLRSLIVFGSNLLDPSENSKEASSGVDMEELNAMAEKVIETRYHEQPDRNDRKFEINPKDFMKAPLSISFDPGLDEASYLSWVEKFKQASQPIETSTVELETKRKVSDVKRLEHEAEKKMKVEEKKLLKWKDLGYCSLAIKDPGCSTNDELVSDSGSVQFVYGDCTDPLKVCPSEPAVIFSCVDNSGNWGHGGMFDALANLSESIPEVYHRASECGDLHLGDLHFININENTEEKMPENIPQWVSLAVVQSYNPRRKVPRSNISIPDLEQCLRKASFSASQNSASIHMPRIGYRDGSDRSEWYTVERLLRKYASLYGIRIFVYYYRRPG